MTVKVDDFLYVGTDEVILEIANDGIGCIDYLIEIDTKKSSRECDWLEISSLKGTVESQEEIILRCNRQKLIDKNPSGEIQNVRLLIKDSETVVAVEIKAKYEKTNHLPSMTFLQNNGVIVIESNHFYDKKDVPNGSFIELKNYGRSGCGMKVFPTTVNFSEKDDKPSLTYRFLIEEESEYTVEVWTTPTNSVKNKHPLRFLLTASQNQQIITAVSAEFKAGNPSDQNWCRGVLDNIRINKAIVKFEKGVQDISIGALEAGLILERILIYKADKKLLKSYLGPLESFYKAQN
jgi:hypothetical protein